MYGTRISSLLGKITVVVVICFFALPAQGKYGGGSGTEQDPYQIWDANDMQAIGADANDWDKHFLLCADIDLSQFDGQDGRPKFNVIGEEWDYKDPNRIPFRGVFDGNNHVILNFTYNSNDRSYLGLFGYVNDPNAEIRNLGLIDPNVDGVERGCVASLVGLMWDGRISRCYAENGSITALGFIGGLVGDNMGGTIDDCHVIGSTIISLSAKAAGLVGSNGGSINNCYASNNVQGDSYVGGLVGTNWELGERRGTITNCHATGEVKGNMVLGGLAGQSAGTISDCYASANIRGTENEYVGGLVGRNYKDGIIVHCYAIGIVEGKTEIGGLIGRNSASIADSYWDTQTSGEPNMCGSQDTGTGCDPNYGKTTAEMMQQTTFTDWDFINVWDIGENQTYPYLRKYSAANINKDQIVNFLDLGIIAQQWLEER